MMAMLPGVYRASKSLQLRASTGNGLSGGTITRIVLGSIFGLLLLVAIFSTCFFIGATCASPTVGDEVAKGPAPPKDIYTAG
jgi:hypothetical protein